MELSQEFTAQPGEFGAVLYTDGGNHPNYTVGSWGLHGYTYPLVEEKKNKFTKKKNAPSTLGYVDGRLGKYTREYKDSSRVLPEAFYKGLLMPFPSPDAALPVEPSFFFDWYGGRKEWTVSQGEIYALKEALTFINKFRPKQVLILGDSQYVLDGITRDYPNWLKRGGLTSQGKPVAHWAWWQELVEEFLAAQRAGVIIHFAKVAAHSGEPGNDRADWNSTKGQVRAIRGEVTDEHRVASPKGYVQKTKLSNRIMEHNWWYGLSDRKATDYGFGGKSVYFFGNHGKAETEDDLVGKDTATAKVAVWVSSEPEPVLDLLSESLEKRYYRGVSEVTLGYLSNILNTERYATILEEKEDILFPKWNQDVIETPDRCPVLKTLRPAYHGFHLVGHFEAMVRIIERYLAGDDSLTVTDLTDKVYQVIDEKNKQVYKARKEIDPPHNTATFTLDYCVDLKTVEQRPVKFKLGADIPTRNTLMAVAGPNTRVKAITWRETATSFRYATIVETEGDILLSASLKSNLIVLIGKRV